MVSPERRPPILNISTPRRKRSFVVYDLEISDSPIPIPTTTTNNTKQPPETETPIKRGNRKAVKPLKVGTHLMCRSRDGDYHPVEIIERRKIKSADGGSLLYEYYVHYTEFNRRLDEWVDLERLDLSSLQKGADLEESIQRRLHSLRLKTQQAETEDHDGLDPASLRKHEKYTKVKNIPFIELGRYEIETWYFSPFPTEFDNSPMLYICEFCLRYMKRREQRQRHMQKCDLRHPPGNEIYRSGELSMFEVDGEENRVYCQNLCHMAKLFLDHKTLLDDVEDFLFYILCECDERGCHMVAYFSKAKQSAEPYNLACILTLPPYQRKGYGKFLIAFSYELSKKEGKAGTPEKPLSDLGKVSYKGYWTRVLLDILKKQDSRISIKELSEMTGILEHDVFCTLRDLKLIRYDDDGVQHIIRDENIIDARQRAAGPGGPKIDTEKLIWSPYNPPEADDSDTS